MPDTSITDFEQDFVYDNALLAGVSKGIDHLEGIEELLDDLAEPIVFGSALLKFEAIQVALRSTLSDLRTNVKALEKLEAASAKKRARKADHG